MLGLNKVFGFSRVLGQAMKDDDLQTIINLASTAELFATTHYLAAINGKLGLADKQVVRLYRRGYYESATCQLGFFFVHLFLSDSYGVDACTV